VDELALNPLAAGCGAFAPQPAAFYRLRLATEVLLEFLEAPAESGANAVVPFAERLVLGFGRLKRTGAQRRRRAAVVALCLRSTAIYFAYFLFLSSLAVRSSHAVRALGFALLGVAGWTLAEYLVHRYVLHGVFPKGRGLVSYCLHYMFDGSHANHHARPWDGRHINGHLDTLYGVSCRMTKSTTEAEDLVQEAFIRLARSAHRIRDEERAAAYLRSIVINLARDHNRRGLVSFRPVMLRKYVRSFENM
jgi:hypothetical protein